MDRLRQDLVLSLRRLRTSPGFTAAAILTLALGIGANATIFTAVNAVLFRPLPVERQNELVTLNFVGNGQGFPMLSYPNYRDLRDRNDVLDGLVAYRPYPIGFNAGGGRTVRILAFEVTGNYFDVLGVAALGGRVLRAEDNVTKRGHPVAVVSHNFWQQRLGGDAAAVGKTAKLNGLDYTIVGIAPAGFFGTELVLNPDVFVPMAMQSQLEPGTDWLESRRERNIFVLGRLKPGVSKPRAEAGLNSVLAQLGREYPNANEGFSITLSAPGLFGSIARGPVQGFAGVLMAVAGIVLLIACINLASLLLARASDRRRETAIRLALGAGRGDLIRQMLTESLVLSIAGGAAGLLLAVWLAQLFAAWRASIDAPVAELHIDIRVMAFAATASLLAGLLSGLAPVLQSTRGGLTAALKDGALIERLQRWHLRDALVAVQVSLSVVLLVGSVLVVRSLQHALNVNLGFQPQHASSVSVDLALQGYDKPRSREFQRRLLEKVRAMPGIESAGLINGLPLSLAIYNSSIFVERKPVARDADVPMAARYWVTPGYLRAAQTRLVAGRDFEERDNSSALPMAIVNQTFARQLWPGEDPLGKRFRAGDASAPWCEIVGVMEDGKYRSLGEAPMPAVFTPLARFDALMATVVARSALPEHDVVSLLRRAVTDLDPALPVEDAGSLTEQLGLALLPVAAAATVLGAFGVLATILAATGVYGTMAYSVSQRTREIGIRMALGASSAQVLAAVLGRTGLLIAFATALGLGLALASGRFVSMILYGVGARDPGTFALAIALITVVALVASWVPARRAISVDPAIALRAE